MLRESTQNITIDEDTIVKHVTSLLEHCHGVLLGPGLGRDKAVLSQASKIIGAIKYVLILQRNCTFLLVKI